MNKGLLPDDSVSSTIGALSSTDKRRRAANHIDDLQQPHRPQTQGLNCRRSHFASPHERAPRLGIAIGKDRLPESGPAPDVPGIDGSGNLRHVILHEPPANHDRLDPLGVLKDADIPDRIAAHHDQVGQEACLELSNLVSALHQRAPVPGRGGQRVCCGEAEELDEVFQITGVGAHRIGDKGAIVAARQDPYAAAMDVDGDWGHMHADDSAKAVALPQRT